jgi:hypothetical protein
VGLCVTLTLADVDGLLYAQIGTLLTDVTTGTTPARPFACVGRFAGALDETSVREVVTQYPAALLCYEGETVTRTVNTLAGDAEDRGLNAWVVYVCVEDARAIDDGTIGTTTAPGGLRLVDSVLGVLNGLLIAIDGRERRQHGMDGPSPAVRGHARGAHPPRRGLRLRGRASRPRGRSRR